MTNNKLLFVQYVRQRLCNIKNLQFEFGNREVCFTYLEVPYISDSLKNDQFQQEIGFRSSQIHYDAFEKSV